MIKEGLKRENFNLIKYRREIRIGNIIAGEEMIRELDNLIRDLDNDEYIYDTSEFEKRSSFMENCCRLTKSPYYNKPMTLMLWQKAWLEALFSFQIYDPFLKQWVPRFNETLLLIGRKNAKSETSSALCLTDFITGGEGRDIVCSSNTDDQANILFDAIDTMRQLIDPDQIDTWRNRRGLTCFLNNNKITKLSERTKNKEGKNIDMAVCDEIHEMEDNTLFKPIEQSTGVKDKYLIILITTEGFVEGGFLDEKLKQYRAVIAGEDTSTKGKRILPWLYTQDHESEVWDVNEDGVNPAWQKSNPSIGIIKKWSYLREQVELAKKSKSDRMFVLSKDFNFKVANSEAWLLPSDYNYETEVVNLEDFRDAVGIAGVDLSETTDLTSVKIILGKKGDKRKYILSHYWCPEGKLESSNDKQAGAEYLRWASEGYLTITKGTYIDLKEVMDWIFELEKQYGIRMYKIGYDKRFSNDFIERAEYYGYSERRKDPSLIRIEQTPETLHRANRLVEEELKGQYVVGLNPMDHWCLGNAAITMNSKGLTLVNKIDNQSARRIDGAVSLIIAFETYIRYRTKWEQYLK